MHISLVAVIILFVVVKRQAYLLDLALDVWISPLPILPLFSQPKTINYIKMFQHFGTKKGQVAMIAYISLLPSVLYRQSIQDKMMMYDQYYWL
jgi:hypothetical protein